MKTINYTVVNGKRILFKTLMRAFIFIGNKMLFLLLTQYTHHNFNVNNGYLFELNSWKFFALKDYRYCMYYRFLCFY